MLSDKVAAWRGLAERAGGKQWHTVLGGNFTEVWDCNQILSLPSKHLVANVNYRMSNDGESTRLASHRNAHYIAFCNPAFALEFLAEVEQQGERMKRAESALDAVVERLCCRTGCDDQGALKAIGEYRAFLASQPQEKK